MNAFCRPDFQKFSTFPDDQKTLPGICFKQVANTLKCSAKQSIKILKCSEETKHCVQCLKRLATCLS